MPGSFFVNIFSSWQCKFQNKARETSSTLYGGFWDIPCPTTENVDEKWLWLRTMILLYLKYEMFVVVFTYSVKVLMVTYSYNKCNLPWWDWSPLVLTNEITGNVPMKDQKRHFLWRIRKRLIKTNERPSFEWRHAGATDKIVLVHVYAILASFLTVEMTLNMLDAVK